MGYVLLRLANLIFKVHFGLTFGVQKVIFVVRESVTFNFWTIYWMSK